MTIHELMKRNVDFDPYSSLRVKMSLGVHPKFV